MVVGVPLPGALTDLLYWVLALGLHPGSHNVSWLWLWYIQMTLIPTVGRKTDFRYSRDLGFWATDSWRSSGVLVAFGL